MSDFPSALARVSEGFCPLCNGELSRLTTLRVVDQPSVVPRDEGLEFRFDTVPSIEPPGYCNRCRVGWRIQSVHDPLPEHGVAFGMGPMLVPSRNLTPDERKRLYIRT